MRSNSTQPGLIIILGDPHCLSHSSLTCTNDGGVNNNNMITFCDSTGTFTFMINIGRNTRLIPNAHTHDDQHHTDTYTHNMQELPYRHITNIILPLLGPLLSYSHCTLYNSIVDIYMQKEVRVRSVDRIFEADACQNILVLILLSIDAVERLFTNDTNGPALM